MIRVNGAAIRPSACALLFLCATALAQTDGVSFQAAAMSFDLRGNSVYTALTVTDGTLTISAAPKVRLRAKTAPTVCGSSELG